MSSLSPPAVGVRPANQRRRTLLWLAAIPLVLCGLGFAAFKFNFIGATRTIEPEPKPEPPTKAQDSTPEFQGAWRAVAEGINGRIFAPGHVSERNSTLFIRQHSVVHRRQPTRSSSVVLNGTVEFMLDGDKQSFTLSGKDQDGTGHMWVGVYRYQDGFWSCVFAKH